MASPTKVVLLACGSFNPVTNMHLRMFELARDSLHKTGRYNVIGGIISPVSDAYGKKDLQPAKHRCAMIRQALKSSNWIRLDTWESDQTCWSETVKVLRHHKNMVDRECNANIRQTPTKKRRKDRRNETINEDENDNYRIHSSSNKDEGVNVKLLCGADLIESFGVPGLWKDEDIEEIVNKYGLVCIPRSGSDALKFIYESDVLSKYQENIFLVTDWMPILISATQIRRALRRGESVKYLVQDTVIDYIREHNLYSTQDK